METNKADILAIERSIITTYRKDIWGPFVKAIEEYNLINENDKIAVAISGGKDSLLLAKCLMEYQKNSKINFTLDFITMNPGYNKETLAIVINNAELLNIPVKIKKSDIFEVTKKIASKSPCYMCARMRRGFLYQQAKENGCNKLALGHHYDDVIETTLLNVLYGSQYKTMIPKIESDNFSNMTLIRPLIYVKEKDIIRWANFANIKYMNCGCDLVDSSLETKRKEIKDLIENLQKQNPNVKQSIFKSATNVNINQVYGYSFNDIKKDFNQIYLETKKKNDEND